VLVETFTFATNLAIPANSQLQIGTYASYADGINFSCKMTLDEFRIWNIARTSSQIQATIDTELVGTESNLKLYYNFNQGTTGGTNTGLTTLTDRTTSGYTGTLNNFGLTGTTSNWVEGIFPSGGSWLWSNGSTTQAITVTSAGNYTVQVTNNGCQSSPSAATVVSENANNTVSTASSAPTLCMNALLTNITHTTTGATGIGTATGLPSGITAIWSNDTITISGTPTESGIFNYTIPLAGGCGTANATGTITVNALPTTPTLTSGGPTTICSGGSVELTSSHYNRHYKRHYSHYNRKLYGTSNQ
jgi:hypothetical protein